MFCLQFIGHSLEERYCRRTLLASMPLLALETKREKLREGNGIFQGMARESFSVLFMSHSPVQVLRTTIILNLLKVALNILFVYSILQKLAGKGTTSTMKICCYRASDLGITAVGQVMMDSVSLTESRSTSSSTKLLTLLQIMLCHLCKQWWEWD